MSVYCDSCGCRQSDQQRPNLDHYIHCQNAPPGTILHLRRRDQDERDLTADKIERLEDEAIHNEGLMVALKEGYLKRGLKIEELEDEIDVMRGDSCGCL